jgi:chromosome segregation ATPase
MKSVLTIEAVRQFCEEQSAKGVTPTTRAIVAELGGSMNKALDLKRQWEEERSLAARARSGSAAVSETLQQAILLEMGKAVDTECKLLREELAQTKARELEAEDINKRMEKELETALKEIEALNLTLQGQISDASRSSAVTSEREGALESQIGKLVSEKNSLSEELDRMRDINMELTVEKLEQVHLVTATETLMKQQAQLLSNQIETITTEGQFMRDRMETLHTEIETLKGALATERQDKAVSHERVALITRQLEQSAKDNTQLESELRTKVELAATAKGRAESLQLALQNKTDELERLRKDKE